MLRNCIGQVRYKHQASKSIFSKIVIEHKDINHEFHKVIKWVEPEYVRPWHPQRSCDLRPLQQVDQSRLKVEFEPFAETINKLPEEQRKLFTIEYGHRKDRVNVIMNDTLNQVKQHLFDKDSLQFKIAHDTIKIRSYQEQFATYACMLKSGHHRRNCNFIIQRRKNWLNKLRAADYKSFEWMIELMGVIYKPDAQWMRIQRKPAIDVLVAMYCNQIRDQKMKEYKDLLEKEKIPFLKSKLATLNRIKEDEESVNIQCSVLEEIEATKKKLEEVERSHVVVHPHPEESQTSQEQRQ